MNRTALLLPDAKGDWFIPRLHTGLDVSSSRRLRIPGHEMQNFFPDHSTRKIDTPQVLEPFFSRRIYETTASFSLVPFFHGEKLTGCLLEALEIESDSNGMLAFFPKDGLGTIASFLVKSRERLGRTEDVSVVEYEKVLEITDYTIRYARKEEKHVIFFIVDLEPIIDRLMEEMPHLDRFYLKNDLQSTISLLSTDSGFCGAAGGDKTILALKTKKTHSRLVIHHQIQQLLRNQCFPGEEMPDFSILGRTWPEDGDTAAVLLSDFYNGDE